ncbi:hypothetical protein JL721_9742 [Aureococcus anophagefferens]|nr:hypothetical protein JL721_9742 [Aureococcus anophagefferens]
MLGRPSMRAQSAGRRQKQLDEGDISTSIYEGADLERLRGMGEARTAHQEARDGAAELRLVWSVLDRNGDNSVTIEEFASFMRRLESNKIDHVIIEAVDKQLAEGFRSPPPPTAARRARRRGANSPSRGSFGDAASVRTAPVSLTALPLSRGDHAAPQPLRRVHRDVAAELPHHRRLQQPRAEPGFQMGRPPEDNESVKSIAARVQQRASSSA